MIEIIEGVWVDPRHVAVVKRVGDDKCALFTSGQSAVDGGFLIERSAEEVVDEIEWAMEGKDGSES